MPEKYSRRDFVTGVLVCGTLSTAAISLFPGSHPLAHAELKLLTGNDPTGARRLLIDMWNRANPHTTVQLVISEGSTGDQKKQMETDARNGTVDIVNLDTIHIKSFVEQELITPSEVEDANVFLGSTIRANQVGGKPGQLWAVPFNTDVGMLFERLPAGDKPQPRRLAAVLDEIPDGSRQFVGQLEPTSSASYEAFVVNILEHALSRDSQIVSDTGVPADDLGRWQQALNPLHQALLKGRIVATSSEDDSLARFMTDPQPRFMRNWPVSYRTLRQKNDQDTKAGRVEVQQLPVGILGGQSLALVARSAHLDRAREVIRFLTGEQAQKVIAMHGLAPTRLAAYNDANITAFIPHIGSVRGAVENARPRPAHANYSAFADAVVLHVRRLLTDNIELPSKFIDDMRDALR